MYEHVDTANGYRELHDCLANLGQAVTLFIEKTDRTEAVHALQRTLDGDPRTVYEQIEGGR